MTAAIIKIATPNPPKIFQCTLVEGVTVESLFVDYAVAKSTKKVNSRNMLVF